MNVPFDEKRRQMFLTESFFQNMDQHYRTSIPDFVETLSSVDNDADDMRRLSWAITDYSYKKLSLHYTAGEPLDDLRNELEGVVAAYEQYQNYLAIWGASS